MAVNLETMSEIGLGVPVFCFICNSSLSVTDGYSTYFTSVANGKMLLADSIKKFSDLKLESEVLDSSFLCRRCFSLFDELELTTIKCNELRKTILDFYTNKMAKGEEEEEEQCDFLNLSSQESEFCLSQQEYDIVEEDQEGTSQEEILPKESLRQVGFQCALCDRVFRKFCNLQNHIRIHGKQTTKLEKPLKEKEKDMSTENVIINMDSAVALNEETESGSNNEENNQKASHMVDLDNKEKRPKKKRQDEVRAEGSTKRSYYECQICGKKWQKLRQLKNHEATHDQVRPFICEICGQAYKRKHALDVHIGMHKGINPFSCHVCGKVFTQKGALMRHTPLHTGEAPYQCEVCGKRFVHHTSFNMHKLAHTGAKTYKCDVCGLKLISNSHLKRHLRIHTGERPFACSHCNRKFAQKYNLMSHLRTHREEQETHKLHVCQVCGLNFSHKSMLEDHLMICRNKIIDVPKNQWISDIFNQADLDSGDSETQPTSFAWSTSFIKPTTTVLHLEY